MNKNTFECASCSQGKLPPTRGDYGAPSDRPLRVSKWLGGVSGVLSARFIFIGAFSFRADGADALERRFGPRNVRSSVLRVNTARRRRKASIKDSVIVDDEVLPRGRG